MKTAFATSEVINCIGQIESELETENAQQPQSQGDTGEGANIEGHGM
jgi:hypothetical protein